MNDNGTATSRVYLAKTTGAPAAALRAGLDYVGWQDLVPDGARVFIKPNFTYPCYKEGITTTPGLVRELLQLLRGRAGSVTVGESDGGNHSFTADEAFKGHDMPRICSETGANLVNLSRLPSEVVEEEIAGKKVRVRLPRLLLEETDVFISMPVLKVHVMTGVTVSIKNQWGCHPDTMRCMEHQGLSYKLALITRKLKSALQIVDGTYGLDGHGPMYGVAKRLDLLMVGTNPVATDALAAALMGIPLDRAEHLRIAEQAGLGETDLARIAVNQDWRPFQMRFTISRTPVDRLSKLLFNSDALARLAMASPLTPVIYKVAALLRTSQEKEVAKEIGKKDQTGLY